MTPDAQPHGEKRTVREQRLIDAILDIDAHAVPLSSDKDGFVAVGYTISVGCLHRALGVVGHPSVKCRICTSGKPCDGLMLEATSEYLRSALEHLATAAGVPLDVEGEPRNNEALLLDIEAALSGSPQGSTDG